jgi:CBS domain containing-hemolysin-like protein
MTILMLFVVLLLVLACAVFAMAEFAFITVNRAAVERQAAAGDKRAKGVLKALKTLSTQLSGSQVGITVTNLAIGFLAEPVVSSLAEQPLKSWGAPESAIPGMSVAIGVVAATAVTMVFGELVPKNIALANPMGAAKAVQGLQRFFSAFMKYPIVLLNGSANFLLRLINIEPQEELASARTAEELASLVRRSADQGTLSEATASTLERSLVFDDLTAQDVMTPRVRMKYVKLHDTADRVVELSRSSGLSRFPVINKNLDDVVGLVHVKQAISKPQSERGKISVADIMHKPLVVPSSTGLDSMLGKLRRGGMQMAIVIDEFGGTSGLVTIEDLLEELVGEVRDEHDSTWPNISKREENAWQLSGLLRPDELVWPLDVILPESDEYDTIGGLIADKLERMPVAGDAVKLDVKNRDGEKSQIMLTVSRMDGRRVDSVMLWK